MMSTQLPNTSSTTTSGAEPTFGEHAHRPADFICDVKVNAQSQSHISLGNFSEGRPPKGFSIELKTDPDPVGSVMTQVTRVEMAEEHEYVLHVTNYGTKPIVAEVWQL